MTEFLNKFEKPCFWPIFVPFSQFLGQKELGGGWGERGGENPAATHKIIWISSTMPKFIKN